MDWFRWHHGTATDAKWRLVAVQSEQPVAAVLSVWALMLERASQSNPRGTIEGWHDGVAGAALDLKPEAVERIRTSMQGLVLDGEVLTGWDRRQPKREDGAAERARRWRAKNEQKQTQPNATERTGTPEESRGEEREKKEKKGKRAHTLPDSWEPNDGHREMAKGRAVDVDAEAEKFRDHAAANRRTLVDWDAGFRNWLRNAYPKKPALGVVAGGAPDDEWDGGWAEEMM